MSKLTPSCLQTNQNDGVNELEVWSRISKWMKANNWVVFELLFDLLILSVCKMNTYHRWLWRECKQISLEEYSTCSRRSATLLEMSFKCNKTQVDFDFNYENKCIYLMPFELRVLNVITNFFSVIINLVRQMDIFTFMNFFFKLIFYAFRQFCAVFTVHTVSLCISHMIF